MPRCKEENNYIAYRKLCALASLAPLREKAVISIDENG
jgi:hypothetical protein